MIERGGVALGAAMRFRGRPMRHHQTARAGRAERSTGRTPDSTAGERHVPPGGHAGRVRRGLRRVQRHTVYGWPCVPSGLKTLLEAGQSLPGAGPAYLAPQTLSDALVTMDRHFLGRTAH